MAGRALGLKKRVVVLDTSFLSNLAETNPQAGADAVSLYKHLFDGLCELVKSDKIVCPIAPLHLEEASVAEEVREPIRQVAIQLSRGVRFQIWPTILFNQTRRALYRFHGKEHMLGDRSWEEAFLDDPDEPASDAHYDFSDDMEVLRGMEEAIKRAKGRYVKLGTDPVRASLEEHIKANARGVADEYFSRPVVESLRDYILATERGRPSDWGRLAYRSLQPLPAFQLFRDHVEIAGDTAGLFDPSFWRFFESENFRDVPFVHVFCSLHAGAACWDRDL